MVEFACAADNVAGEILHCLNFVQVGLGGVTPYIRTVR